MFLSAVFARLLFFDQTSSTSENVPLVKNVQSSSAKIDDPPAIAVFYCNARSIVPKAHLLLHYTDVYDSDVIAITETWLDENIPSSLFCPPAYVPYRHDRCYGRGGGAAILVKHQINSKAISVKPSSELNCHIDAVACQISLAKNQQLGVLCIYRPPNSDSDDNQFMMDTIDTFLKYNFQKNVIIGDFNLPDIDWISKSGTPNAFLDFCQENFLTQHILRPTRIASGSILRRSPFYD